MEEPPLERFGGYQPQELPQNERQPLGGGHEEGPPGRRSPGAACDFIKKLKNPLLKPCKVQILRGQCSRQSRNQSGLSFYEWSPGQLSP